MITRVTKFMTTMAMLAAMFAFASQAKAGEAAYRIILTPAGSTNVTYTVGRYEKPRLTAIETVGVNAGTNQVVVTYGDAAGGTRTLISAWTNGTTAATSNSLYLFSQPYPDLAAADVITVGYSSTTNGSYRIHCVNRDTKPVN